MKVRTGEEIDGPYGRAIEILYEHEPDEPMDWTATVAQWFLICPGQSPAWDNYMLGIVHLRPIEGAKREPYIAFEGATHEVILYALDPQERPIPTDYNTWHNLSPMNFVGQYTVPSDEYAKADAKVMALAVIHGLTWAEPPLSGQKEPWQTQLRQIEAHHRGEHDDQVDDDPDSDRG